MGVRARVARRPSTNNCSKYQSPEATSGISAVHTPFSPSVQPVIVRPPEKMGVAPARPRRRSAPWPCRCPAARAPGARRACTRHRRRRREPALRAGLESSAGGSRRGRPSTWRTAGPACRGSHRCPTALRKGRGPTPSDRPPATPAESGSIGSSRSHSRQRVENGADPRNEHPRPAAAGTGPAARPYQDTRSAARIATRRRLSGAEPQSRRLRACSAHGLSGARSRNRRQCRSASDGRWS